MSKLQELKEQYERLGEKIEELEDEKIDFSEYVGRCSKDITIKGKNNLISGAVSGISFSNPYYDFNHELHYTKTTISELEKGDVFIKLQDVDNMRLESFRVYIGEDNAGDFGYYYLSETAGLELLESSYSYVGKKEVYKFLRE